MRKKIVVWGNINTDFDAWKADLPEEYLNYSEGSLFQMMLGDYANQLDYIKDELNITLKTEIINIADLGLWNGRHSAYKDIGRNLAGCFSAVGDMAEWYIDSLGDLRCTDIHHDGTNRYLYRALKQGLSNKQIDNFLIKLISGKVTREDITRYTFKLGDIVKAHINV